MKKRQEIAILYNFPLRNLWWNCYFQEDVVFLEVRIDLDFSLIIPLQK